MRTQITLDREATADLSLWNRPLSLGLLLAPVCAALGTGIMLMTPPWSMLGSVRVLVIVYGMMFGTLLALPVTLILLPLLHRARVARLLLPIFGAAVGALGCAFINLGLPGYLCGGFAGAVFMRVRQPEDSAQPTP